MFMFARRHPLGVRPPAVAGSFYPGLDRQLESAVDGFLSEAEADASADLIGVVAPHAGYIYSGGVAGCAFASAGTSRKVFERVLLIGPAHYLPVRGIAAPSVSAFATPLGEIPVDAAAIDALKQAGLVEFDDAAHAPEHALEVELPFLQRVLSRFNILPLLVGTAPPEQVAKVVSRLMDGRTLLVVSTDLSHYLDDAAARKRDLATAETIERLDFTRLGPEDACGFSALNGALYSASERGWRVDRLDLRNSGDTSGDYHRVVGYGAWTLSAVAGL